jgi:uncharacterized protein (TIGR03000 family)
MTWSKLLSWGGALALGGAAFLWPQAGQAQSFRAPAAGTLPPRYGSSSLPAVPYYGLRDFNPTYYPPTAPTQGDRPEVPLDAPPSPWPAHYEPPAPDNTAVITARVPAGAELRFNGVRMPATGAKRQFKTPPLKPGQRYAYTVEARWQENGREITQSQRLPVSAGEYVPLVFPLASAGGAKGPASPRP